MRLQFAEGTAKALLDPINLMKESAAINPELPSAKLPVAATEVMQLKQFPGKRVRSECALRSQHEIRHVLFVFEAPRAGTLAARVGRERNAADLCRAHENAVAIPRVATSEGRSMDAVAHGFAAVASGPASETETASAGLDRER